MQDNFSFSQKVNRFIDSLAKHNDTIEVVKISDNDTLIRYESYEHEPIRNYPSPFEAFKRNLGLRNNLPKRKTRPYHHTKEYKQMYYDKKIAELNNMMAETPDIVTERRKRSPASAETKEKISKKMMNRELSDVHKARLSANKAKYFENLRNEKKA